MTPHSPSPQETLAAYVEGDLDSAARDSLEPPQPTEAEWNAMRKAVHRGILQTPIARNWWLRAGVYFAGGIAAAVAAIVLVGMLAKLGPKPEPPVPVNLESPDEFAVLPMATDDDVEIERIAGSGYILLVGDAPLALAGEDDVQIEEAEPHPAWPGGSPKMILAPGDAPMIFAAKSR